MYNYIACKECWIYTESFTNEMYIYRNSIDKPLLGDLIALDENIKWSEELS